MLFNIKCQCNHPT